MTTTLKPVARRPHHHAGPVLEVLDLPGRMAATDALFWYAESALPIFRP
jgi:hypothetical protein